MTMTNIGKEELAVALLLWRDFKCQGKFDPVIVKQMIEFAEHLGIQDQLNDMMSKLPPMVILPRN